MLTHQLGGSSLQKCVQIGFDMRIPLRKCTETRQSPGVSHTVGEVRMENPALKGSSQEDEMVVGFDALDSQKPKGFKGKMTIECPTEFQTIHRNQSKSTIQRSQGSLRLRSFQGFVLVLRLPSVMHQSTRRSKFNNHCWEQTHGFLLKWGTSGFFFLLKRILMYLPSPPFSDRPTFPCHSAMC